MPLINWETILVLTRSNRYFVIDNLIVDQEPTFAITVTNNTKLLKELKSGFKRTTNWSKHKPKVTAEQQNQYLDFLINPSFQEVNRIFIFII